MPLSHTSLYEICLKQGTSASLLGKKTFVYGQNMGTLMGFTLAMEMVPFKPWY